MRRPGLCEGKVLKKILKLRCSMHVAMYIQQFNQNMINGCYGSVLGNFRENFLVIEKKFGIL